MSEYVVHGAKGSGSVIVEAALTLLDLPYRVIESGILTEAGDPALAKINPMRQVPALILPGGELMTESAAILIWLADDHPEARLAPTMASAARPAFLRWMAFASSIYALYWARDDAARVTDIPEARAQVKAKLNERIAECWGIMDRQIDPAHFLLSNDLTVLDLYVGVMSRWAPGRKRFEAVAPKMSRIVRRVDHDPRLVALWAERMPFEQA